MLISHVVLIVVMTIRAAENGVVVGIGMALIASIPLALVSARVDRKIRTVMVKIRVIPASGIVTHCAIGRETSGEVIRIVRILIIIVMTKVAIRRCPAELSVNVACGAIHKYMGSGERERGLSVIKRRRLPCRCRVTHLAVLRIAVCSVIRSLLIVVVMAGEACGRCVDILTTDMTL